LCKFAAINRLLGGFYRFLSAGCEANAAPGASGIYSAFNRRNKSSSPPRNRLISRSLSLKIDLNSFTDHRDEWPDRVGPGSFDKEVQSCPFQQPYGVEDSGCHQTPSQLAILPIDQGRRLGSPFLPRLPE
jgi:hypothetical protein